MCTQAVSVVLGSISNLHDSVHTEDTSVEMMLCSGYCTQIPWLQIWQTYYIWNTGSASGGSFIYIAHAVCLLVTELV